MGFKTEEINEIRGKLEQIKTGYRIICDHLSFYLPSFEPAVQFTCCLQGPRVEIQTPNCQFLLLPQQKVLCLPRLEGYNSAAYQIVDSS